MTLIAPCIAPEPYTTPAGPRRTSIELACSLFTSNSSLTLQKPTGRIGMLFSRNRNVPHDPGPISTGERIAMRLSSPLLRWIIVPGARFMISAWWVAPTSATSLLDTTEMLPAKSRSCCSVRVAVTTTSSTRSRSPANAVLVIANATTWAMRGRVRRIALISLSLSARTVFSVEKSSLWQREGHDVVAALGSELAVTAGGDHHELPAVRFVAHRCRLAAGRQPALPELPPGFDVEGAEIVIRSGADERKPAVRDHGSAHVRHAQGRCRDEPRRLVAGRAEHHLPADRIAPQVDGRQRSPRGRRARQAERRGQHFAAHAIRGAGLWCEIGVRPGVRVSRLVEPVAWDQRHDHGDVIDGGDHELTLAVERCAAPIDAAGVTRRLDRALQARRREDAFRAIVRDEVAALAAVVEGEAPGVVRRHGGVRHQGRGCRKRL